MIYVTFPMRTVSEANSHTHWRDRQRRAKGQRQATSLVVSAETQIRTLAPATCLLKSKTTLGLVVKLTRLSVGTLDDDNLRGALKHVRDGVADALGIDDRDPRVQWDYAQLKAKSYGVSVSIRKVAA